MNNDREVYNCSDDTVPDWLTVVEGQTHCSNWTNIVLQNKGHKNSHCMDPTLKLKLKHWIRYLQFKETNHLSLFTSSGNIWSKHIRDKILWFWLLAFKGFGPQGKTFSYQHRTLFFVQTEFYTHLSIKHIVNIHFWNRNYRSKKLIIWFKRYLFIQKSVENNHSNGFNRLSIV